MCGYKTPIVIETNWVTAAVSPIKWTGPLIVLYRSSCFCSLKISLGYTSSFILSAFYVFCTSFSCSLFMRIRFMVCTYLNQWNTNILSFIVCFDKPCFKASICAAMSGGPGGMLSWYVFLLLMVNNIYLYSVHYHFKSHSRFGMVSCI